MSDHVEAKHNRGSDMEHRSCADPSAVLVEETNSVDQANEADWPLSSYVGGGLKVATGDDHGFAIKAFVEMKPGDPFEQMLFAQMAMTHKHANTASARMVASASTEQTVFYEKMFTRLTRTFVAQLEALRKHRGKGVQTVKHVHVNEGGQAVVADVFSNGGGHQE